MCMYDNPTSPTYHALAITQLGVRSLTFARALVTHLCVNTGGILATTTVVFVGVGVLQKDRGRVR